MLDKGFNALDDDEDNTVANRIILKHYFYLQFKQRLQKKQDF